MLAEPPGGAMQAGNLSGEDYAALVEQAPIMIWRAGTDGLCDYFNERWLAFTGRTMAQEAGSGWAEGVYADDLQRCLETYAAAFERREVFEMEYRLRRHDGCFRWIFDRGVPRYDDTGAFAGYIGSCIDVTGRVEAERALRQLQEARIKTLHGLLPICVGCKKIRNDSGYWESVETYIREHSEAQFSHGFCPECARSYYEAEIAPLKERG
jgi:PAS domain S-box-containing protein